MIKRALQGLIVGIGGLTLSASLAYAQAPVDLLDTSEPTPAARQALDSRVLPADVLRARAVNLRPEALRALDAGERRLRIEFFSDQVVEVELEELPSHGSRGRVWRGKEVGRLRVSDFYLARHGDATAVMLSDHSSGPNGRGRILKLFPGPNGTVTAMELEGEKQQPCGVTPEFAVRSRRLMAAIEKAAPQDSSETQPPIQASPTLEIDMAVFWTPKARIAAGGENGIRALIDLAIANANLALGNSLNQHRYILVHASEAVGYDDAASQLTDLNNLTNPSDGILDEVHTIRSVVRADLVALITGLATDSCGIAWLMDNPNGGNSNFGFSVTAANCISGKTFAHEVGHNLGCMHARADGGTGIFPYSFGLRFTGNDTVNYRTVMAYSPGTRIDHFSNPSITFQGVPTGIPSSSANSADNARTMNETFANARDYRSRKTGMEAFNLVAGPTVINITGTGKTGTLERGVAVGNTGSGSANVSVTLTPTIPGITADTNSFTATPTEPRTIRIAVNTDTITSGSYTQTLSFTGGGQTRTVTINTNIAPPPNNIFANIRDLPPAGGSAQSTTAEATTEVGEPLPAGVTNPRTVWWRWRYTDGPNQQRVRVSTLGSRANSFVAVYTGSALNQLILVGSSRTAYDFTGGISTVSEFTSPGEFDFTATRNTTYIIQVGTESDTPAPGGPVQINLYPQAIRPALSSAQTFIHSGQDPARMSQFNLGSVARNDSTGVYAITVNASNRTRVFGILENADTDLPYSAVGPDRFVRAHFHVSYSGPGDSNNLALANLVPNFRLGMRTRAAANAVLEVIHNPGTSDPANADLAREFGPSKDPSKPSRYTLDFDPIDVPALANSPTEGIQRSFEAVAGLPDYTYVSGTLRVTETSIFTYPALRRSESAPIKVYKTGGAAGASDFNNPGISNTILGFSRDEVLRYSTGSPNANDYFGPGVINVALSQSGMSMINSQTNGITFTSIAVPTSRIGLAAVDFLTGTNDDRTSFPARVRSVAGARHMVSFRVNTAQNSNSVPYLRFRTRTAKFSWSSQLELNGARALDSTDGRTLLAQVLPGAGNGMALNSDTRDNDGFWYNVIIPSPLDRRIRADRQTMGNETIAQLFPLLANEPGPGENAPSRRDILVGFDVVDTLSFGTQHTAEAADSIRLNRIEVRIYPELPE